MLIYAMRAWLRMQENDTTDGWLLALRDPVIAPGDERHPPAAQRAVDDPIATPGGQRVAQRSPATSPP
jgi:hypothetical protein